MSAPTKPAPFSQLALALEAMRLSGGDTSELAGPISDETAIQFAAAYLDPAAEQAYAAQDGRSAAPTERSAIVLSDDYATLRAEHTAPLPDIDGPVALADRRIHVSYEVAPGQYSNVPTEITVTIGKMAYRLSLAEETCLVYNARENAAQARVITAGELEMISALIMSEFKKADCDILTTPLTIAQKQGILKFIGTRLEDLYAESFNPRVTITRTPVPDDLDEAIPSEGNLSAIHMRLHDAYITLEFDPKDPNAVAIKAMRMKSIPNTPIGEVIRPFFDEMGPTASEIAILLDELTATQWKNDAEFEFIIGLCEELTTKYDLTDADDDVD